MKHTAIVFLLFASTAISIGAQTKPKPKPKATPAKIPAAVPMKAGTAPVPASDIDKGSVAGRTYTNKQFGFEVTFPDTWLIPDDDFEAYMKSQGFDLGLKAPDSLPPSARAKINAAIKRVDILLTAYRSMPGSTDNAIVRISVEDLSANPQIKDAVDYFDAVRAMYAAMRLPADFKYSETQAEKLGSMHFGYLDASTKAGKKRMYATVRKGFAVMFTISYSQEADLDTLRQVLSAGDFFLK
ncbi:MAG: hypothetical protein AB7J13_12970 [Pyrinomonadaceae bacterium]